MVNKNGVLPAGIDEQRFERFFSDPKPNWHNLYKQLGELVHRIRTREYSIALIKAVWQREQDIFQKLDEIGGSGTKDYDTKYQIDARTTLPSHSDESSNSFPVTAKIYFISKKSSIADAKSAVHRDAETIIANHFVGFGDRSPLNTWRDYFDTKEHDRAGGGTRIYLRLSPLYQNAPIASLADENADLTAALEERSRMQKNTMHPSSDGRHGRSR